MKRNRPLPISFSRLTNPSIWVNPISRHTRWTSKLFLPGRPRAHRLNPETRDLLGAEPLRRLLGEARKICQVSGGTVAPGEEIHMQQDCVFRLDLDAGRFDGLLQILDGYVALELLVGKIETNGFGKEVLKRDLVDR